MPKRSINIWLPASSTDGTKSGSITVSLMTNRVSYLFVGSVAEADCVLMKYIVAIVGFPKSSKIVIDVELVNVFGSLASKA